MNKPVEKVCVWSDCQHRPKECIGLYYSPYGTRCFGDAMGYLSRKKEKKPTSSNRSERIT